MFAVFDTETTGISPHVDRVIEVAVCVINDSGEELERFESLVRPEGDVPAYASERLAHVADAPSFGEIAGDLAAIASAHTLVAHNAVFDLRMLSAEFGRLGLPFGPVDYICTHDWSITLGLDVQNHSLAGLCHYFGVDQPIWHVAMADAVATCAIFVGLVHVAQSYGRSGLDISGTWPGGLRSAPDNAGWPQLPRRGLARPRDLERFPPSGPQPTSKRAKRPSFRHAGGSSAATSLSVSFDPFPPAAEAAWLVDRLIAAVDAGQDVDLDPDLLAGIAEVANSPDRAQARAAMIDAYVDLIAAERREMSLDESRNGSLVRQWRSGQPFMGVRGIEELTLVVSQLDESGDPETWIARRDLAELLMKHGGRRDETHAVLREAYENAPDEERAHIFDGWWQWLETHRDTDAMVDALEAAYSAGTGRLDALTNAVLSIHRCGDETAVAERIAGAVDAVAGRHGDAFALGRMQALRVRALERAGDADAARQLSESAWAAGSRDLLLADRLSLMLERSKQFEPASHVAGAAAASEPERISGDHRLLDTLRKRRDRCNEKAQ